MGSKTNLRRIIAALIIIVPLLGMVFALAEHRDFGADAVAFEVSGGTWLP